MPSRDSNNSSDRRRRERRPRRGNDADAERKRQLKAERRAQIMENANNQDMSEHTESSGAVGDSLEPGNVTSSPRSPRSSGESSSRRHHNRPANKGPSSTATPAQVGAVATTGRAFGAPRRPPSDRNNMTRSIVMDGNFAFNDEEEQPMPESEENAGHVVAVEQRSEVEAYVAGQDPNAVAASGVITEEELEDRERVRKTRFLCGGVCCFCILIIAIVVPLLTLAPKEETLGFAEIPSASPTRFPTMAPSLSPTPGALLDLLMELEILYPNSDDYLAAFNSSDTVQHQALVWATGEGNPGGLSGSDPRMISRYALATFYFATNGDEWVRCSRDGKNCDPGSSWLMDEDECGWLAITCEDGTSDVTQIFFPPMGLKFGENNVAGSLPFELGLLTNLKRITISRNNIGGSLPATWADLTTLEAVILSDNHLTGELPSTLINNNQGLRQLRLSGNKITQLPQDPIRSSGLTILDVQNNALEGPIPEGIQGLSALQTLDLRGNNLNDTIPETLFEITTLRNLYLADNELSGNISASFGELTDIRRLELTSNNFTGAIPDGLCALKADFGNLQFLTADCNKVVCDCCDNDCMREFPNPSDTGV